MGLDYPYTCPDIDTSINAFKRAIAEHLSDMLDECCPMLEGKQKDDFVGYYVERLYREFEDSFENVRNTNIGMRNIADCQIDNLEERLKEAEKEIQELNERIKQYV